MVDLDLVFMNSKHTEMFTDTLIIAKQLEVRHYDLLRILRKLIKDGHISKTEYFVLPYDDRGRKLTKYGLTPKATLRLIMSTGGKNAEIVKTKFVDAFATMSHYLSSNSEWNTTRQELIVATKTAKASVQKISLMLKVELPTSSAHEKIYMHIDKWINTIIEDKESSIARDLTAVEKNKALTIFQNIVTQTINNMINAGKSGEEIKEAIHLFLTNTKDIL